MLSTAELQARVAAHVAGQVRPSNTPDVKRLAAILGQHEAAGELEQVDGCWRLTPLGRERFGGLNDPLDVRDAA